MTAPPTTSGGGAAETSATYSFALNQGESATIAIESLNGKKVAFSLLDDKGNVLALSSPGATNYTAGLNNFVATDDATYYVQVTGDPGAKFNLVVTRGADFTTQPHTTLWRRPRTSRRPSRSGDNKLGGALGYLQNPSGAVLGTTIEGIDFNGSNCGCLPPDTNAAVGNGFVAETVNVQFRVWDTTGNELLDEPLEHALRPGDRGRPLRRVRRRPPATGTSPPSTARTTARNFWRSPTTPIRSTASQTSTPSRSRLRATWPTSPSSATTPTRS